MPRGGRKKRWRFCLPSCFSVPPEALAPPSYLARLRGSSKTVPVTEIAGEGHVEVAGETQSESGQGNPAKGLLMQKFRKEENSKNSKTTIQPHAPTPPSVRTHHKAEHHQTIFCHVSTKLNSPLPQLLRTRDPVQNIFRTSHLLTLQPNRPAGPAQPPARPTRRLNLLTGLLMLTATLTVTLLFGRLCAVLCNCASFYLLSCFKPPPSPAAAPPPSPAAAPPPATERDDVDSPAYKKKVVLMGLLERNRCGVSGKLIMTTLASSARLR